MSEQTTVKKKKPFDLGKTIFLVVMLIYPIAQFLVFYVYMNFNNIMMAFKGLRPDGSTYFVGLENFKKVFTGTDSEIISISFWNNMKMFFWTTLVGMPLNILFGYYLYKEKPGTTAVRIVYMLPNMVSGVVMTLLFMKFVEEGMPTLYAQITGKSRAEFPLLFREESSAFFMQVFYTLWLGFSTSLIIYSNAMYSIDVGIIEAGKIDGVTNLQEIVYIIVPLIFPTLSTYMITGVSSIFTISGSIFLFYGVKNVPKSAYLMGYYLFKIGKTQSTDLNAVALSAAVSILITIVTIPLTMFTRWGMDKIDPMRDVVSDIG